MNLTRKKEREKLMAGRRRSKGRTGCHLPKCSFFLPVASSSRVHEVVTRRYSPLYPPEFLVPATSMVVPCMTTLVSKFGTHDQKGTVMGIFRSLGALARAMGPILASILYWCIGSTLTYIAGGLFLLIPWLMMRNLEAGLSTAQLKKEATD
ncbi:hypothetical protein J437_LFUL016780 [Ladona fulva]|uniref:Major facilitator superfamily (MFS) profile domain-containing protein n=1 Tax=Ladona fulva TaxID=123851 RepID=A0A8K0KLB3_LADFU|nr:hypothetical protein J437_LFUL016780 [Ladona fulva]